MYFSLKVFEIKVRDNKYTKTSLKTRSDVTGAVRRNRGFDCGIVWSNEENKRSARVARTSEPFRAVLHKSTGGLPYLRF